MRPMGSGIELAAADLPPAPSLSQVNTQQTRDLPLMPDLALPFEALPNPNPSFFLSEPDEKS